jgi:hypothetical protein
LPYLDWGGGLTEAVDLAVSTAPETSQLRIRSSLQRHFYIACLARQI